MVPMRIRLVSLRAEEDRIVATARAYAAQAQILLECEVPIDPSATYEEILSVAKDEILRYLDPA